MVPRAGLEPARISPHAPQTCAATNYATSADERRKRIFFHQIFKKQNYLFDGWEVSGGLDSVILPEALAFPTEFDGTTTAVFEFISTFVLVPVLVFVSKVKLEFDSTLAFEFSSSAGAVSVELSALVSSTEIFPVKAGIARSSAESINVVAAAIVILERIVCEPLG